MKYAGYAEQQQVYDSNLPFVLDILNTMTKEAKQVEFEAQHGVKSGDKVTTKGGTTYFYERFIIDAYGWITILCHPAKKDGTASKADRHLSDVDF
jgi:hypothetical protein